MYFGKCKGVIKVSSRYLPVDDLVDGHLRVELAGVGRGRHAAGRAHVAPEPELLAERRAAPLRALHVLVYL